MAEFMERKLFMSMTDEVLRTLPPTTRVWSPEALLHPQLDLGLADRPGANPDVANDIGFVLALRGARRRPRRPARALQLIIPKHAANADAAKEFPAHYTGSPPPGTQAVRLPGLGRAAPSLEAGWPATPSGPTRPTSWPSSRTRPPEHQHRLPGAVHRPGHRRGVRDLRDPEHVRQRGPRRGLAQGGGGPGRGPDQADLREVAEARPGRRHVSGGRL